jgi:DNA-binding CsgD family transcriptional regulator
MAVDFAQFVSETNRAPTVEDAFNILETYLAALGFDRVVYSLITDHPSLNRKRGHGILRNYPDDWMQYYFAKDYVDVDPVIKVIRQTSGAFLWHDLDYLKRGLSREELTLMHEAREARLLDGIGLSLHGGPGEIVGMGVASSSGGADLDIDTMSIVYALCSQFHIVYRRMETTLAPVIVQLSAREREVLTWTAEGKSRTAIGEILHISDQTVKTYMKRIFAKLEVNSIQLAVVKAIALGLISPAFTHVRPARASLRLSPK